MTKQERVEQLQGLGFEVRETEDGALRVSCSQCQACVINGHPCHETGCINGKHNIYEHEYTDD